MDESELNRRFPLSGSISADYGLLTALNVVLSNATLEDMVTRHPRILSEFLTVSGVGIIKAQK